MNGNADKIIDPGNNVDNTCLRLRLCSHSYNTILLRFCLTMPGSTNPYMAYNTRSLLIKTLKLQHDTSKILFNNARQHKPLYGIQYKEFIDKDT